MGLDMTRGSLETGGAFIQGAIDMDMSELPALEAGFVVLRMVTGQGGIMVTASPPNVGLFQGDFLFFDQEGRQGREGQVLRSSSGFFDEVLSGG